MWVKKKDCCQREWVIIHGGTPATQVYLSSWVSTFRAVRIHSNSKITNHRVLKEFIHQLPLTHSLSTLYSYQHHLKKSNLKNMHLRQPDSSID